MQIVIKGVEVWVAGHLEVVDTPDGGYRILMVDAEDTLMGLSKRYGSVDEAAQGVEALREVAGTGLLRRASSERYAVLMLEEPEIDSALAGQSPGAQVKVGQS